MLRIGWHNACFGPEATIAAASDGTDAEPLLRPALSDSALLEPVVVGPPVPTTGAVVVIDFGVDVEVGVVALVDLRPHLLSGEQLILGLEDEDETSVWGAVIDAWRPPDELFCGSVIRVIDPPVIARRLGVAVAMVEPRVIRVGAAWAGPVASFPGVAVSAGSSFAVDDRSQVETARDGRHFARRGPRLRRHDLRLAGATYHQAFGGGSSMDLQALQVHVGTSGYCLVLPRTTEPGPQGEPVPSEDALHRLGIMAVAERWGPIIAEGADRYRCDVVFREVG